MSGTPGGGRLFGIARADRLPSAARESWAALGASAVLAGAMTWPTLAHPATTVPEDTGDPLLQTWQVAWGGHALVHQLGSVFDSNTFYPLRNTLAFSDSLLGYAPVGLLGSGPTAALVHYNLLFVAAFALASGGAYLLARQLGCRRVGAAVAGLVFAYAPWRLSQAGHLHILSTGGIPLALALLARGHDYRLGGRRVPQATVARPACAVGGWLVAAWQVTLGFGLGLAFSMVVGLVVLLVAGWWLVAGRPAVPRRLVLADVGGGLLFAAAVAVMAAPYLKAVHDHPEARRTLADVAIYSPPWRGFVTTPATDWLWGSAQTGARTRLGWPPEMTLAPGLTAALLAVLGLSFGAWTLRRRVALAGFAVVAALFAMGTRGPWGGRLTYRLLFDHVPGWQGVRTPSRLVVWTLLALGLLAAVGADRVVAAVTRWLPRSGLPAALTAGLLAGLIVLEGIGTNPHPRPAPEPAVLRTAAAAGEPMLVLPSDEIGDETVMWWSTDGFPRVVNGGSGFVPRETSALRAATADFPSTDAVRVLRAVGVHRVVVLLERFDPGAAALLRGAALPPGVTRTTAGPDLLFAF